MHINELSSILNQYFNLHKARCDCLAQLVIAMITVKTVNFTHLATAFITKSFQDSCYKRIQRFFRFLQFDPFAVASMVIALFGLKNKKLNLALDRTNWKFGKVDINILIWSCLKKRGNSNPLERISLIKHILLLIGPKHIDCLLGDREFLGAEWIQGLEERNISFLFRIRKQQFARGSFNSRSLL